MKKNLGRINFEFVCAKICAYRKKRRMTQEQLAKAAGVERKMISRLETYHTISLDNLCAICEVLDLGLDIVNMNLEEDA